MTGGDAGKQGGWFRQHKLLTVAIVFVVIVIIGAAGNNTGAKKKVTSTTPSTSRAVSHARGATTTRSTVAPTPTAPPTTVPTRHNSAVAVTLGAGNYTGGRDVATGLYDVTTSPGQSGNFIVNGADSYNEILGSAAGLGVPKIRVKVSNGDEIQISGLSQVVFTPVTAPLVTRQAPATLYAGTWTVGQDVGPGRYVATPGPGQSGNFIIVSEGVNEILGGSLGVPSVTFTVHSGDVISISSLSQVTLTPA